ncbi:MAG: glycosyltransferase family 8 protein, partial [Clostridia bacterium]|nr:glycosyltransferase family 8 protein [Clostridia bacterium]
MDINICLSSDDNYAKFLGVTFQSIIEKSSPHNQYDVYILDGGITELNKTKLNKMQNNNCKLHFVEMKQMVKQYNLDSLRISGHISLATYYRLFLSEIF